MPIKILLGGSPCTYWSIAQTKNRETEPSGLGWELFENYLIAKEKFKPDFFLYENNVSAARPIKEEIKRRFSAGGGRSNYIEINSALVSAQNRKRFYVHNCGDVNQPEDRGILLRDILESGLTANDKAYALTHIQGNTRDYFKRHHTNIAFEPVAIAMRGRYTKDGEIEQHFEARSDMKGNALTTATKNSYVAEPIRIGDIGTAAQAHRVYSCDAKSVSLKACSGGQGGKTGLYLCPVFDNAGGAKTVLKAIPKLFDKYGYVPEMFNAYNTSEINDKSPSLTTGSMVTSSCATTIFTQTDKKNIGINKPFYKVENGYITVNEKQYPIKLADGYYIIRPLTVTECCRLQTLPDDYCRAVSKTQAYKGLGNGWTAEVIIHILNGALGNIPRDEKTVVLSMYDGIGTGRYCLDKMGFTNVEYHAFEIDKYAMQISKSNYPDIIYHGDAYQVRNDNFELLGSVK